MQEIQLPEKLFDRPRKSDQDQQNVFALEQIEISRSPTTRSNVEKAEDRSHWMKQIRFVCIPFLILGFPVHLFYRQDLNQDSRPKTLIKAYLHPTLVLFQTAMLVAIPMFITAYISYHMGRILYYLLIVGGLEWNLFVHGINFALSFPAVIPLYFCWWRGPCVLEFISSFDLLRWDFFKALKSLTLRNRPVMYPRPTGNRHLKKIFALYLIVAVIHLIPAIVDNWVKRTAVGFWISSLYSCILPLYCALCWAVYEEYKTLSRYLKSLMVNGGEGPTLENLAQIKTWYRKIGRHVIYINHTIGYYLCWVLPEMILSIGVHIGFLLAYFLGYVSLKGFFYIQDLLLEDEILEQDGTQAALFRKSVAHSFVAFLRVLLMVYAIKQAVDVNDEARFTHVLLNEYLNDHSTWILKNDDLYRTSRHLKSYMYATHEKDNPAFLRILVIYYCPFVSGRLHKQSLRDVIAHGRFLQEVV